jgi:hypothetical protein
LITILITTRRLSAPVGLVPPGEKSFVESQLTDD